MYIISFFTNKYHTIKTSCKTHANGNTKNIVKSTKNGGQGEIRTPGSIARTHPFQGCTIDHSDTCPQKYILYIIYYFR